MGTLTAPEIREFREQTPLQRAKGRHEEVISICNHLVAALHAWGRLGRLCTLVERDKDYLLLGFESFGQWMMRVEEVSGYSRASAYAYRDLFRSLEHLGEAAIEGMSLGSAHVVRQLPSALQRNPEVLQKAKRMKPKELREYIAREHPESHVEMKEELCLKLDESVAILWHEALEGARLLNGDPQMTYEQFLELELLADWLDEKRPLIEKIKGNYILNSLEDMRHDKEKRTSAETHGRTILSL